MKRRFPANFYTLSGVFSIGAFDENRFRGDCAETRASGLSGVYFGDVFFQLAPPGSDPGTASVFYQDDRECILDRADEELLTIRRIVNEEGLSLESAHFTQTLPPPGKPVEDIFPAHERLLDMARLLELKYVTTHIGWMYGGTNPSITGEIATDFLSGRLAKDSFYEAIKKPYGGAERMLEDSKIIYRHLCEEAAKRDITITMETACSELLELCCYPDRMIAFFEEIGVSRFGLCVDPGHCHIQHLTPADVIRACGDHLVETHFHDNFGVDDSHLAVGEGNIDWLEIIQALKEIGYRGVITFEQSEHRKNVSRWNELMAEAEQGAVAP
jgi:sugar phosphate isomerase/epimerase